MEFALGIGIIDWELGFGIRIGNLGLELGIEIGDWDGMGLGIGHWDYGLVGRILHWNIVEHGGGWNSRTLWRIEHSRRRRLGLVGPENIALVQRQAMAACSL